MVTKRMERGVSDIVPQAFYILSWGVLGAMLDCGSNSSRGSLYTSIYNNSILLGTFDLQKCIVFSENIIVRNIYSFWQILSHDNTSLKVFVLSNALTDLLCILMHLGPERSWIQVIRSTIMFGVLHQAKDILPSSRISNDYVEIFVMPHSDILDDAKHSEL